MTLKNQHADSHGNSLLSPGYRGQSAAGARSWPAASQAVGEAGRELLTPASHGLVGDDDATLGQDQLDIPQAEAEDMVEPDGVADDLGRKPMTVIRVGWCHAVSLTRLHTCSQPWLP